RIMRRVRGGDRGLIRPERSLISRAGDQANLKRKHSLAAERIAKPQISERRRGYHEARTVTATARQRALPCLRVRSRGKGMLRASNFAGGSAYGSRFPPRCA